MRNEIHDAQSDTFVYSWNIKFPFDYWWRKLYKVSFGSKEHRETSLVDMYVEFMEHHLFNAKLPDREEYVRGHGSIFKEKATGMPQEDFDDLYDNIDISKLNG
jgi:hypothetical protein